MFALAIKIEKKLMEMGSICGKGKSYQSTFATKAIAEYVNVCVHRYYLISPENISHFVKQNHHQIVMAVVLKKLNC